MPYKRSKSTTKSKAKHLGQNTKERQLWFGHVSGVVKKVIFIVPINKSLTETVLEEDHQNDLLTLERRVADRSRWKQFMRRSDLRLFI